MFSVILARAYRLLTNGLMVAMLLIIAMAVPIQSRGTAGGGGLGGGGVNLSNGPMQLSFFFLWESQLAHLSKSPESLRKFSVV